MQTQAAADGEGGPGLRSGDSLRGGNALHHLGLCANCLVPSSAPGGRSRDKDDVPCPACFRARVPTRMHEKRAGPDLRRVSCPRQFGGVQPAPESATSGTLNIRRPHSCLSRRGYSAEDQPSKQTNARFSSRPPAPTCPWILTRRMPCRDGRHWTRPLVCDIEGPPQRLCRPT